MERDILYENKKDLTDNIIISKNFNDEIRIANRKRAMKLVSFHRERFLNE
jgi:hypothetical protein